MKPEIRKPQQGCEVAEETDPVEQMIEKTGCAKLHYALQECMAESQDWRKCQSLVKEFRVCMEKYQSSRGVSPNN